MPAAAHSDLSAVFRLSSNSLPARERLSQWREMYGRKFLHLEHEPLSDLSFEVDLAVRKLPDCGIASVRISPLRVGRTRELVSDGNDGLTFQLSSTAGVARQLGREVEVEGGQAIAMSNADVGTFDFPSGSRALALSLSRGRLGGLVRNLEDTLVRAVPNDNQAIALLKSYIGAVDDGVANPTPELAELVVAHIYDLAALALGAAGDAAAIARGRGVRAARLVAAKAFVRRHLHRSDLRADSVAAHLGVTPRYVHMLFEPDGCSFLEYVLAERLARAYRVLRGDWTRNVSAVAFASGFGDLSHFNRTFRRHFGRTPSEVRGDAQQDGLLR
ncbi:MAG: AraC family transcriptional regulator [Proteobacteria bacterium]|nr:MAG: AraC family transcriptional regulator [Pseudomonadota bacterium]